MKDSNPQEPGDLVVRAELKRLYSPDVLNLESFLSEQDCFGIFVQAFFGPEGSDGEEAFDILVCTASFLETELAKNSIILGHHYLFVKQNDYQLIHNYLKSYAEKCEGSSWHEVALQLSRIGHWEFEGYEDG